MLVSLKMLLKICDFLLSTFQVQGVAEGGAQYGPGPASWGAYDMQRAHGHR